LARRAAADARRGRVGGHGALAALKAATGRHPANDLWIAATALAHDLTLVTADERQAALPLVRARLWAERRPCRRLARLDVHQGEPLHRKRRPGRGRRR
jgi:hypothetical protein